MVGIRGQSSGGCMSATAPTSLIGGRWSKYTPAGPKAVTIVRLTAPLRSEPDAGQSSGRRGVTGARGASVGRGVCATKELPTGASSGPRDNGPTTGARRGHERVRCRRRKTSVKAARWSAGQTARWIGPLKAARTTTVNRAFARACWPRQADRVSASYRKPQSAPNGMM
jgi:hypothetical protein